MINKIGISIAISIIFICAFSVIWHLKGNDIALVVCGPKVTIQQGTTTITQDDSCAMTTVLVIIHDIGKVIRSQPGCRCVTEVNGKPYVQLLPTPEKCLNTKQPDEEDGTEI